MLTFDRTLLARNGGALLGLAAGDALTFRDGALPAVNADTTGVYGHLAGA